MSHSPYLLRKLPCLQGQVSPKAIKRPCPTQASSVFSWPVETQPGGCLEVVPRVLPGWNPAFLALGSLSPSLGAFPSCTEPPMLCLVSLLSSFSPGTQGGCSWYPRQGPSLPTDPGQSASAAVPPASLGVSPLFLGPPIRCGLLPSFGLHSPALDGQLPTLSFSHTCCAL